jgi:hypothetical protein
MIGIKFDGLLIRQVGFELLAGHPLYRFAALGESMNAVIMLPAIQFKHPALSELLNGNVQAGDGDWLFFIAFKDKARLGLYDFILKGFDDTDFKMMQTAVS